MHLPLRTSQYKIVSLLRNMSKEKMALFVATTTFRRNVMQSIAVGGSQRRSARNNIEREGNDLLSKVKKPRP